MSVFEDAARKYAEQDFYVLPLRPREKVPLTTHGLDDATVDTMTIETWWSRWPDANVGIRTGSIVVIDEDHPDALIHLAASLGRELPATRTARTGIGRHYYFIQPEGVSVRNTAGKLAPGIDTRGDGGYVVAPPSVHPNGTAYVWELEIDPAPLPPWLVELLQPEPIRQQRAPLTLVQPGTTPYGQRALEEEAQAVATAIEGTRNDTLNNAALKLGSLVAGGELDEHDTRHALLDAALSNGLSEREATATLNSGMNAGLAQPRNAPPSTPMPQRRKTEPFEIIERLRLVPGGAFAFDEPSEVPPVWGGAHNVAWAEGEGLLLVGPDGVGKTALQQQLLLTRLGLRDELLGFKVKPAEKPILYIAADRPRQAARSLRRMVSENERDILDERLIVWKGPLPFDIATDPQELAPFVQAHGAGDLFIDALKDIALDLNKDESGGRINRAFQECIASDIELCVSHHQRKEMAAGKGTAKPTRLSDVYGSRWITAGMGSVILLWGEAGDLVVELSHLKQPAEDIGPFKVRHDHRLGQSIVFHPVDLEKLIADTYGGITVKTAAAAIYDNVSPTANQIEKARRRLETLVGTGRIYREDLSGASHYLNKRA